MLALECFFFFFEHGMDWIGLERRFERGVGMKCQGARKNKAQRAKRK